MLKRLLFWFVVLLPSSMLWAVLRLGGLSELLTACIVLPFVVIACLKAESHE